MSTETPREPIVLRMRPPAEATRWALDHMSELSPPAAVVALTSIVEEMLTEAELAAARLSEVEAERDAAIASKDTFVAMLELAPRSRMAKLSATRRELDDTIAERDSTVALYEAEVAKLNRIIDEITAAHVDADQMWAKERRERITERQAWIPVVEAARAVNWSDVRACVLAVSEDEREPQRYHDAYVEALAQVDVLIGAVDSMPATEVDGG